MLLAKSLGTKPISNLHMVKSSADHMSIWVSREWRLQIPNSRE